MKIRSMSVAVLAAVPLAIAGCSQQAPSGAPAAPEQPEQQQPAKPSAESVAWVDQMCGLVGGFAASQQSAPPVDKSSTAKFKESSIAQMTAAEKSANDTVTGLREMPESPIEGGKQVSDSFADGFVQVRDLLSTAKTKAEQTDPSNKEAFTAGMTGVQQELKKGQSLSFEPQFKEFSKNQQLAAAADQAPQCQALTKQAQQPPQQPQPPQ